MQQERTLRVERFSNASSHGTSNMSTGSGTQTEGSVAEYWKQHGALRASYLEEVLLVYTTFEKFLAHDASDENGLEERRQVEYYMEFVQFCKVVLEEQTGLSAPRPWEDLARVRKYIQNIISPYVAKIAPAQGVPTQPQPTPPPVQIAWHGRRHNDGGSRPTIFDVNTVSSLHPSSPSGSFTSGHSDDDIDYWRQHAILKESHFANCLAVQAAFQQYLARPLEASNPKQRNKLEYLLGYVNFCCQVLNESPSTHPVRPYADYKRVVKSINKIITPYMQKIHMENQTKALPSVNDLVQRAAPPNNPQVAAYWQQLAQLKQSYFSTVAEAHRFFQSYIEWFQGKRPQEQIQEIVYLVDYAEFCGQVMQEESRTHPPRTMEELNHVYNYITTIIIPHWDKLRAEAPRPAESVVSVTSSALQQTDSFLVEFDTDRLSVLSSSVHRSAVTDTSMSSVSSAEAKAYWRKLAALKELYADKVGTALSGFQKYAAEYSHAKSAAEARKLARLYEMLESVQFCATMFSETEQTHPPRDPADLDMIHQYIIQIVNPYCVRLETETKLLGGHHNNTIT